MSIIPIGDNVSIFLEEGWIKVNILNALLILIELIVMIDFLGDSDLYIESKS